MISPLVDLDRHAAETPDAVAIASPRLRLTFGELRTTVVAVAHRLREAGVRPRHVVGVDLPGAPEWIIDLALLRLATCSVSLRGVPSLGRLSLDVVIAAPGSARRPGVMTIEVDSRWIADAAASAPGAESRVDYPRPDSVFRLMLTSGTTGMPRAAAYTVQAFESRRLGLDTYWTDARPELDFMPLSTTGGFHTAVASLRHGQAYRAVDRIDEVALRFAADEGIQVLAGSPQHLATALEVIEEHGIRLEALEEVRLAGATPGESLLQRIREVLGVPIRSVYGSTEGGGVTSRMLEPGADLADLGHPIPGMEVQVVGADGTPAPTGTEGLLRYRGPGMTVGYLEAGTIRPFADGWFVPGDLGSVTPDGSVRLSGRASEVVNLGGFKVNPDRVDELARAFPGVRDAAAFPLTRADGRAELGLAVVGSPGFDVRALDARLREVLPVGHPTAFWGVPSIPRNRMGKAERAVIAEAYTRTVGR